MSHSTVQTNHFRNSFAEAQQRYIDYFLKCAKASIASTKESVEVELPNVRNAFYLSLHEKNAGLVREFWEAMSGYFWNHGFWLLYLDWGENTLAVLHRTRDNLLSEAWLMSDLGWLRMEWRDFSLAEELFYGAKEVFYAEKDTKGICTIERYFGVLAYRTGDLEKASEQYKIAEGMAKANNYELSLSEIFNLQGSLEKKRGNLDRARKLYSESKQLVEKLDAPWRLTATLRNLAQLDVQLGYFEKAKVGFEQTIELCLQADRKDMLYGCQIKLAEVEQRLGNVERAKELALAARNGFLSLGMNSEFEQVNRFLESLTAGGST